jgi:hypothetical protein
MLRIETFYDRKYLTNIAARAIKILNNLPGGFIFGENFRNAYKITVFLTDIDGS